MTPAVSGGWETSGAIIRKLETVGLVLACLCVCLTLFIVAGDTFMRYALNSPWPWAVEATTNYLLVGAAYLGISATFSMGDHINLDLLQRRFSPALRAGIDALLGMVFILVFGAIGYLALSESLSAAMSDAYIPGYIRWPVWLSLAPIPAGILILCIRLTHHVLMLVIKGADPFVIGSHGEESAK